ncbi:MAG: hypothetical protein HYV20_17750 [Gemmatimonadetes bacterium]|nr:hypothetical protein [Gemmatimonadota bacterium]
MKRTMLLLRDAIAPLDFDEITVGVTEDEKIRIAASGAASVPSFLRICRCIERLQDRLAEDLFHSRVGRVATATFAGIGDMNESIAVGKLRLGCPNGVAKLAEVVPSNDQRELTMSAAANRTGPAVGVVNASSVAGPIQAILKRIKADPDLRVSRLPVRVHQERLGAV